jgi:hypothetical protein
MFRGVHWAAPAADTGLEIEEIVAINGSNNSSVRNTLVLFIIEELYLSDYYLSIPDILPMTKIGLK